MPQLINPSVFREFNDTDSVRQSGLLDNRYLDIELRRMRGKNIKNKEAYRDWHP